jgi:hypothetical protein
MLVNTSAKMSAQARIAAAMFLALTLTILFLFIRPSADYCAPIETKALCLEPE